MEQLEAEPWVGAKSGMEILRPREGMDLPKVTQGARGKACSTRSPPGLWLL